MDISNQDWNHRRMEWFHEKSFLHTRDNKQYKSNSLMTQYNTTKTDPLHVSIKVGTIHRSGKKAIDFTPLKNKATARDYPPSWSGMVGPTWRISSSCHIGCLIDFEFAYFDWQCLGYQLGKDKPVLQESKVLTQFYSLGDKVIFYFISWHLVRINIFKWGNASCGCFPRILIILRNNDRYVSSPC